MDELEARIAAIEMAVIEVFAELDPAALRLAKERIGGGIPRDADGKVADQDEATVRLGALQLIDDAQRRFQTFSDGVGTRRKE